MNVTRAELLELAERYREQTRRRPQAHPLAELGVADPYADCRDTHAANEDFLSRFNTLPGSPEEVRAGLDRSAQSHNNRALISAACAVMLGGGGIVGSIPATFLHSWQLGLAVGLTGATVLTVGIQAHNRNGAREDELRWLSARVARWERSAEEFKLACPPRPQREEASRFADRGDHLLVGGVRLGRSPKGYPARTSRVAIKPTKTSSVEAAYHHPRWPWQPAHSAKLQA